MLSALLTIASLWWGATPACGAPVVSFDSLEPGVVGVAYMDRCTITLANERNWQPGERCMVTLHEFGHQLGLGHSTDPRSIMYPVLGVARWPCRWGRAKAPLSGSVSLFRTLTTGDSAWCVLQRSHALAWRIEQRRGFLTRLPGVAAGNVLIRPAVPATLRDA